MIKQNFLKEKLQSGNIVVGTWSIIPSPIVSDIIASSGLDFIIIDAEHGPVNYETAQNMILACESHNVSPVMRTGGVIQSEILRALEIGTHCIQIPNIVTMEQLNQAVLYSKYPPLGDRGFSPFTRAGGYTHENSKRIDSVANDSTLIAIHIEGQDAIQNIDSILTVEQIDIIFIGMYDLSKSLGLLGQVDHPDVFKTVQYLTQRIVDAGKYPGTIVTNEKQLSSFINIGMKYITYSVDCELLLKSYQTVYKKFKKILKR